MLADDVGSEPHAAPAIKAESATDCLYLLAGLSRDSQVCRSWLICVPVPR